MSPLGFVYVSDWFNHRVLKFTLDGTQANEELGLPADGRDYAHAAAVLKDLGVRSVRLLTNNPAKQSALESRGVPVKERVPMTVTATAENGRYLATKVTKMGHLMEVDDGEAT